MIVSKRYFEFSTNDIPQINRNVIFRLNLPIVLIILNNNGIGTGVDTGTFKNVEDPTIE